MPSGRVTFKAENSGYEFVKSDDVEIIMMSHPRKEAKRNKDDENEKENPTNIGPGITESNEEV